jgi:hypothetical protein
VTTQGRFFCSVDHQRAYRDEERPG